MNIRLKPQSGHHVLKKIILDEDKKVFLLSIYFSAWFCAITFLIVTTLNEDPIPLAVFGFAIVKGALAAKFLLIGQALFPMKVNKSNGVIRSLFLQSLLYVVIVLALNYLEAGVDGVIHGKNFVDSMATFGQSNPLRVLSMCVVYWLIVCPYLVFVGMKISLGSTATIAILFGERIKPDEPVSNT